MVANRSGFRRLFLLFFSLLLLTMATGVQTALPAYGRTLSSDPVVNWIQDNAIPLQTTNPGGSDADLTPLKQIVANASIVGLGEETHGTHEFMNMKARITEFLISHMGFTTFVMEDNWGSSQIVDAYINGKAGNINDIMSQGLFVSWQTQEYRDLLEWMRTYNANPAHTKKIHFLGMDFQGLSQRDFDTVENYLQRVDPRQVAHIQDLYAPILAMNGPASYDTVSRSDASNNQQKYQNQAQQVYDLLQANQQNYVKHSSAQNFALALQSARIITQSVTFYNANTEAESLTRYYQRDTFMAENVAWIYDHEAGSNPKMIVWAHNIRTANDTFYGTQNGRNMGGELRARYKDSYLSIGATLYQGTFSVYSYPTSTIQKINPPAPDTYNYSLGQAGFPLYMLDLSKIPSASVRNWDLSPSTFVNYGLGGEDLSNRGLLSQSFDVIIHIQNTTPSKHLNDYPTKQ